MMDAAQVIDILRGPKEELYEISHIYDRVRVEGADLAGLDLSGITIREPLVFRQCNFRGSRLDGSHLQGEFIACDLSSASFDDALIDEAIFDCCNMSRTSFDRTVIEGFFRKCNLADAAFGKSVLHAQCSTLVPEGARGILYRSYTDVDENQDQVYLLERSPRHVVGVVGCQYRQPRQLWRWAMDNTAITARSKDFADYYDRRDELLPLFLDMIDEACRLNAADPSQWQGAPAERQRVLRCLQNPTQPGLTTPIIT